MFTKCAEEDAAEKFFGVDRSVEQLLAPLRCFAKGDQLRKAWKEGSDLKQDVLTQYIHGPVGAFESRRSYSGSFSSPPFRGK
mmetsp:Transcript_15290/g.32877  ORF Transcript_15290/g.32877 Transcript_15290/m.32877 type:complete len:82 (+) Transcript_15290:1906-2151(+)